MMASSSSEAAAAEFLTSAAMNIDTNYVKLHVFPGENVVSKLRAGKGVQCVKLGSGLSEAKDDEGEIVVTPTYFGELQYRAPNTYWVDSQNCKKYLPKIGDHILGIVEERSGEYYRVCINSGSHALLNRLSFDGATKRNKPELKPGDVVYCRVIMAFKDCETEITCTSAGVVKDWTSGESVYGSLNEGLVCHVTTSYCKSLLKPDCVLLNCLGRHLAFEIAIGLNGVVWVKAEECIHSIVLRNAIMNAEQLREDDSMIEAMVAKLAERLKKK